MSTPPSLPTPTVIGADLTTDNRAYAALMQRFGSSVEAFLQGYVPGSSGTTGAAGTLQIAELQAEIGELRAKRGGQREELAEAQKDYDEILASRTATVARLRTRPMKR